MMAGGGQKWGQSLVRLLWLSPEDFLVKLQPSIWQLAVAGLEDAATLFFSSTAV